MTPTRWRRLQDVFDVASGLHGEERESFLAEACAGDSDLAEQVRTLLFSADKDQGTMEREVLQVASGLGPDAAPAMPERIGAYRVLREIGRGGMGVVYLAERDDDHYSGQVAIKLLSLSYSRHPEILRRFRRERQILAGLNHPNIGRLFDGGTAQDGSPYFIMEYVQGRPITGYCDQAALPLRQRLELFAQLCDAVQHAHRHLVIHRDIKPGNVLVTTDGVPKLLDFGIAKLLDAETGTPAETTEQFSPLTPQYASPEQVSSKPITLASDVYSLGLLLYQLLSGKPAFSFAGGDLASIFQRICKEDPPKPSLVARAEWRRQLRGDLDNIVMLAIRKDPSARYASVEQLGEDIRRHLEGRPVRARAATWSYLSRKFVERHTGAVAAAALLVVTLCGGIVSTTMQARKAQAQAVEAQREKARAEEMARIATGNGRRAADTAAEAQRHAAEAERQRLLAERRYRDVQRMAHDFLFRFDNQVMHLPGSTPVRQLVVSTAQDYLAILAREGVSDRETDSDLAASHLRIGMIQRTRNMPNLGDTAGAAKNYRKALTLARQAAARHGDSEHLKQLRAAAHSGLGDVCYVQGDLRGAIPHYRSALAEAAPLAQQSRSEVGYREQLRAMNKLADTLRDLGESREALGYYREAVAVTARKASARPSDQTDRDRIVALGQLARMHLTIEEPRAVLDHIGSAEAALDRLLEKDPTHAHLLRMRMIHGALASAAWRALGDRAQALPHSERQLVIARRLATADPRNLLARHDVNLATMWKGIDLVATGARDAGFALLREAVVAADQMTAVDPASLQTLDHRIATRTHLAEAFGIVGQPEGAVPVHQEMVTIAREGVRRQPGDGSQLLLANTLERAAAFHAASAPVLARDLYQEALEIHRRRNDGRKADAVQSRLASLR